MISVPLPFKGIAPQVPRVLSQPFGTPSGAGGKIKAMPPDMAIIIPRDTKFNLLFGIFCFSAAHAQKAYGEHFKIIGKTRLRHSVSGSERYFINGLSRAVFNYKPA